MMSNRDKQDSLSISSIDTEMSEPNVVSEVTSMQNMESSISLHECSKPLDLKKGDSRNTPSPIPRVRSPRKDSESPIPSKMQKISNGINYGAPPVPPETGKETPEDLSLTKDDDDDDDGDDDSDKMVDPPPPGMDPERLKSFNMFVRLFVDENLDRIVPISKQPKEKIQAIIEACYRQFPEFHERARKRIRTYLKSCRRMKRQRDQNGIDSTSIRPTPPHLTSARAEQILAAACESESENAKRLRMELMQGGQQLPVQVETHSEPTTPAAAQPTPPARTYEESPVKHSPRIVDYRFANGVAASHDPYPGTVAPYHATTVQQAAAQHTTVVNGPTDLSVKKLSSTKAQLSPTEIANIRQLITSYRESAAFLYRSADELEQMLLQL